MQSLPLHVVIWFLNAAISLIVYNNIAIAKEAPSDSSVGPAPELYQQMAGRGIRYLRGTQSDDGSWSHHAGPAVTALVATALIRHGRSVDDPMLAKALGYLENHIRDDGGIYQRGTRYRNYETCLAIVSLSEANIDGRYDQILQQADHFVGELQWDEGEGHERSSPSYGGFGYGKHNRPDMSNTQISLDAFRALGKGAGDPCVEKALVFISRCQNLESAHNTTPFATKVEDGGFYYTVAAGGSSQAGETPNGGLRSYGSMTYAGLKSMIYAGVSSDDPRVTAAYQWIQAHYTLAENPGMGAAGLYYYYHTFAKALDTIGTNMVEDTDGSIHDWRRELAEVLASEQHADGSWTNPTTRWLEGDPHLVTAYALLALDYCRPPPKPQPNP